MGKHDGASDREWNGVFRANGLSTAMKWNQDLSNLDKQAKLVCGNFQAGPPKCLCQSVTKMFEKALGSHP
jgi:hypothetical protein